MYSSYCRHSLLCTKNILSVCVFWIINVNHYGAMLCTQSQNKGQQTLTQKFKTNKNIFLNLQHVPFMKDLTLMSSCDPTGVCHMVLIMFGHPRSAAPPLQLFPLVLSFCKWWDFAVGPVRRRFTWVLSLNSRSWEFLLLTCGINVAQHSMTSFVKASFLGLTKLAIMKFKK